MKQHPIAPGIKYDEAERSLWCSNTRYHVDRQHKNINTAKLVWECLNSQVVPTGYKAIWIAGVQTPCLRPDIYDKLTFMETSSGKIRVSVAIGTYASRAEAEREVSRLEPYLHELGAGIAFYNSSR